MLNVYDQLFVFYYSFMNFVWSVHIEWQLCSFLWMAFDFCNMKFWFELVSKFFIDGIAPATKTMSGATIHTLNVILLMSG